VSKKFRTGEAHDSLRDLVPALLRRATRRATAEPALADREFWAVRDVSFRVGPGEVLGIIGANGAGKSTVLKLLTRLLRPTGGRVEVRGRIGALIEVAAGFHPDLTGRENVFLQGAILGMRTAEVARKFDAIVQFAGVEDFIDTPVKRYSSGMNARLGFSIAAHLEPDVLVIDEVLSVGDFAFQSRAFARLTELAERGTPVVVVSHQLDRVVSLCTSAIVLEHGAVAFAGSPAGAVGWYTTRASQATVPAEAVGPVVLERIALGADQVDSGGRLAFRVHGVVRDASGLSEIEAVGLRLRSTGTGEIVSRTSSTRCGVTVASAGPFAVEGEIQLNVPAGIYLVEVHPWDARHRRALQASLAATVTVREGPSFLGAVQLNASMRLESAAEP
jgi:ABC-type polysaccharide/polyol phosphate transport system ATPase subunit